MDKRELSPRAHHHLHGRRPILHTRQDEQHETAAAEAAESPQFQRMERLTGVEAHGAKMGKGRK